MEILFNTYYRKGRKLSRLVKKGDSAAIKEMALEMSSIVPENVVLVPIPSHIGYATFTLELSHEISRLTGTPVADILRGKSRISNYTAKKMKSPLSVEDLGFEKISDTELTPCFVDNVCDTGVTMRSAFMAFNRGIGMVYARTKKHLRKFRDGS